MSHVLLACTLALQAEPIVAQSSAIAPEVVLPPVAAVPPGMSSTLPTLSEGQRHMLVAMLDDAASDGLSDPPPPQSVDAARSPPGDPELIAATLVHARSVQSGCLEIDHFQRDWALRPMAYDPLPSFIDAIARDRLQRWIDALPPPFAGYDALRKALASYRAIEAAGNWPSLVAGGDLAMGAKGTAVAALRARLQLEDEGVAGTSELFDAELRDAVQRAQRRYGIDPTGIVSVRTRAALNVPVGDRIRQIMLNMERWRWVPRLLAADRIQVNIAAAVMLLFEDDEPVIAMRAVTGRPGHETPMLESQVHSIVINPPWNVPTSIAGKELWPKERAHRGYLKRNGFRVLAGGRLQQSAGPKSALGRLKFDFDNPFSVYLHDTPTQATFARFDRLTSHGCVRLAQPLALAKALLADDPAWPAGVIDAAIAKGDTTRARLPKPMPVYLFYWTAYASSNGQINFRADPYGWDARLSAEIAAHGGRAVSR